MSRTVDVAASLLLVLMYRRHLRCDLLHIFPTVRAKGGRRVI